MTLVLSGPSTLSGEENSDDFVVKVTNILLTQQNFIIVFNLVYLNVPILSLEQLVKRPPAKVMATTKMHRRTKLLRDPVTVSILAVKGARQLASRTIQIEMTKTLEMQTIFKKMKTMTKKKTFQLLEKLTKKFVIWSAQMQLIMLSRYNGYH